MCGTMLLLLSNCRTIAFARFNQLGRQPTKRNHFAVLAKFEAGYFGYAHNIYTDIIQIKSCYLQIITLDKALFRWWLGK